MNKTFLIVVGGFVLIVFGFVFAQRFVEPTIIVEEPPFINSVAINIKGEITCLTKKGTGPHTMECAIGLRGEDGNHYGLQNLFDYDSEYYFSTTGIKVEVSGMFFGKNPKGPSADSYDTVGNIEITSIKEISAPDNDEEIIMIEGQRESSFLLETIFPDSVSGLNFWEYPIATEEGHPLTLKIGEVVSNGCTIRLTLKSIDFEAKTATFNKKVDFNAPCPICLSGNTLISTPSGEVPVKDLKIGDPVWTTNLGGQRVSSVIEKTSKVLVPSTHKIIHLELSDGRELWVSPGHPLTDIRTVFDLRIGEIYDGAIVTKISLTLYDEGATYDILPSGETGFYFANGILIGSTLR